MPISFLMYNKSISTNKWVITMSELNIKEEIDNRIDKCMANQSKADSEAFSFDVYIKETLHMALDNDYENGICGSYVAMAARAISLGNLEKGHQLLQKVDREYRIKSMSPKVIMRFYGAYTVWAAETEDDFEIAFKYATKEMEAAEELGDTGELMRIKMNIGAMSIDFNFHESAKSFLMEAYEYYLSIDDHVMVSFAGLNLAQVYEELKDYNEATRLYEQVLVYGQEENEITLLINGYIGLAGVKKELKLFDQAIDLLGSALLKADEIHHLIFKTEVMFELISIYKAMGKFEAANQALNNIESLVGAIDDKEVLMTFYEKKSLVKEALGDFKEAFLALKQYTEIYEKVNEYSNESAMNQLIQMEYKKSLERLEAIAKAGRQLTILSDIGSVLVEVRNSLIALMDVDAIGIGLIRNNLLHYDYYFINGKKIVGAPSAMDDTDSFGIYCIKHKEPIHIKNHSQEYKDYLTESSFLDVELNNDNSLFNSILYAPLIIDNKVIGVFTIQSNRNNAYSSADVKIYHILTDYIAIAVKNARGILG